MSAHFLHSPEHKRGHMVIFCYYSTHLESKALHLAFSWYLILKQLLIYEGKRIMNNNLCNLSECIKY